MAKFQSKISDNLSPISLIYPSLFRTMLTVQAHTASSNMKLTIRNIRATPVRDIFYNLTLKVFRFYFPDTSEGCNIYFIYHLMWIMNALRCLPIKITRYEIQLEKIPWKWAPCLFYFGSAFLHVLFAVIWLYTALADERGAVETWRIVTIVYCLSLNLTMFLNMICVFKVRTDCINLINATMSWELGMERRGVPKLVSWNLVLCNYILKSSLPPVMLAAFALSILVPCMPPLITSFGLLECKSWVDDGGATILQKIVLAMYSLYYYACLTATVGNVIAILLCYFCVVLQNAIREMRR